MKKMIIYLALVLTVVSLTAQENIRGKIAIVFPEYGKTDLDFFEKMSVDLVRNGYTTSAISLKMRTYGTFGSGFVYSNAGKHYVITNKHVVSDMSSVTIKFLDANDDSVVYKNCPVIAVSPDLDIALVALPDTAKVDKALSFHAKILSDGADVWTAGYPGLGGKPMWQLGKGIVSNQSIKDQDLADPTITSIIQHTAQIDGGSSGGPLLVKINDKYEVVGINTWKARGREGVNLSIPIKAVETFIKTVLQPKEETAEQRAKNMLNPKRHKDISQYISYSMIQQISTLSLKNMLAKISKDAEDEMNALFSAGRPIDALRLLTADIILQSMKTKGDTVLVTNIEKLSDSTERVSYTSGKKITYTDWTKEQNVWNVTNSSEVNLKAVYAKNGIASDFEYKRSIGLTLGFPLGTTALQGINSLYGFTFESVYSPYFAGQVTFFGGTMTTTEMISGDTSGVKSSYGGMEISLKAQLPIRLSQFYLIPYAKIPLNIMFSEEAGAFSGYSAGMNFGITVSKRIMLYVGLDYSYRKTVISLDDFKSKYSYIGLTLGMYF